MFVRLPWGSASARGAFEPKVSWVARKGVASRGFVLMFRLRFASSYEAALWISLRAARQKQMKLGVYAHTSRGLLSSALFRVMINELEEKALAHRPSLPKKTQFTTAPAQLFVLLLLLSVSLNSPKESFWKKRVLLPAHAC